MEESLARRTVRIPGRAMNDIETITLRQNADANNLQ